MPLLQRFDEDTLPAITTYEMNIRWGEFHRQIRLMSGTRFQRTAGRILGEDTRRYRLARFVFRPILKVLRGRRTVQQVRTVAATNATVIFPINYRPRTFDYALETDSMGIDASDVVVVDLDESSSAEVLIESLNNTLNDTTAEWIFLADASWSTDERRYSVACLLARATSEDDVVFGDEPGPHEFAPILKSSHVGPHTLLSYNVVGRPALLRVETLFGIGGFSLSAASAFEHDAYLRLSERDARFHHVSRVLPAGRRASAFDAPTLSDDTCRVVQAALDRRGWSGVAVAGELPGLVQWIPEVLSPAPSIDIIIPTRDRVDLVRQCVASIEEKTTYENYDIILLDNDSVLPETLEYFASTKYRVVSCPGPFNYAHIVNRGVKHSSADYVVTLNNDAIVVTPTWLERMVGIASLDNVGVVGACLLDKGGRREHESIVIAPYPQHLRTDSNYPHVDHFSRATRDVAAVTGAVQMVERSFWEELGGMDEKMAVVMNDVDICLRSQMEDRYVVYCPDVQLFHHVGSSRGVLDPLEDRNRFIRRWDIFGSFRDPYFPEALTLLGEKMFYHVR